MGILLPEYPVIVLSAFFPCVSSNLKQVLSKHFVTRVVSLFKNLYSNVIEKIKRDKDRAAETQRNLPYVCSFPKCLQQLGLDQSVARSPELHLVLPVGGRDTSS